MSFFCLTQNKDTRKLSLKRYFNIISAVALATAFSIFPTLTSEGAKISRGPVQELAGPGGRDYQHRGFNYWEAGIRPHERYLVFEPAEPMPSSAGFVLFIHDYMFPSPKHYIGQIRHLCQKGWIVVFPFYAGTDQPTKHHMFNVIRSVKDYLQQSFLKDKIKTDTNKFAILGHGSGAVLAANTAACYDYFGLPVPKVLVISMPDSTHSNILDLSGISRETRMAVISGDRLNSSDAKMARDIFYTADRVKTVNKIFVIVQSDYFGQPPLLGDKSSGLSPENPKSEKFAVRKHNEFLQSFNSKFFAPYLRADDIENFDWRITYRVFDMLGIAAFTLNSNLNPMKKSEELRSMGYWSNGRRVRPLIITDRP